MMRRSSLIGLLVALAVSGCASTRVRPNASDEQWTAEARAFDADPSLMNNERALYRAGVLFGTPGRPTYEPAKARTLLLAFLERFPGSERRDDATDRLALLDDIVRVRRDAATRQRELEARIDVATAETRVLREKLDSASQQGDQMRRNTSRLETDLREREEQLRALRLELQRLKEIDLKPRRP
jgi:hypothetical protein